uniref:Prepilin-type N-terminal cleavage/methylation domain-containing protein n=1 Tax=uncultured Desulfobacterium sp. TaxID=201089 RepID=E1Y8V5_9BACT|nr:hypothetical protein N47_A10280 [uncultured Desulfobacterium sp.]
MRCVASNKGLTLVELMVAMGLTTIVLGVIYASYTTQSRMNTKEAVVLNMQQNIRGALNLMESEIRMAGYDPKPARVFGITDIRFKDINGNPNVNGYSSITFTADNGTNPNSGNGALDSDETYTYRIYDYTSGSPAGILDLGRTIGGGGNQIAAEGIDAIGLAYAYDNDGDGKLDVSPNGNILWAIDTNNDNKLDTNLETVDDGVIDINDNIAGTAIGGSAITTDKIRAMKLWILARTKTPLLKYTDNNTYVVANRRITPNDSFKRELLETTIKCRNLGFE